MASSRFVNLCQMLRHRDATLCNLIAHKLDTHSTQSTIPMVYCLTVRKPGSTSDNIHLAQFENEIAGVYKAQWENTVAVKIFGRDVKHATANDAAYKEFPAQIGSRHQISTFPFRSAPDTRYRHSRSDRFQTPHTNIPAQIDSRRPRAVEPALCEG